MIPEQLPPGTRVAGRNFLFGKVAAEHTLGQAADEIARLGKRLSEQHPKRNSQRMAIAVPLRDAMMGPFQRQLWILFAMAVLVLLVACLNSGSLLLAQAMHRRREFAVRLALGANHGRLLRQFWLENIGLTLLAALLSLLLAMWVTPLLMAMLPTFIVGNFLGPVAIQWGAWSVALSCALGAALLFALLPWGIARHLPIEETLRSGGRSTGGGMAGRLGRWFVSGQIAVALTLAVGAGLLLQSGRQLQGTDFGFPTEELFQFRLSTRGERYAEDADRDRFYQNVRRELAQLPGVRGVSMARFSFPNPNTTQRSFVQEGDGLSLLESPKQAQIEQASPETLETFGLRLLHGRFVEETDTAEMPPVTVVSAALAERYWPGENPVGKRVRLETMGENWWTVVGVVSDRLSAGHRPRVADTFIVPFAQVVPAGTAVFVRFAGAEPPAYETMQRKIWDMNPDASMFFNVRVSEFYANSAWQQRFSSTLISGFAGLAIVLCATGLYAVLAFMVASRTREMGIRSALGANSRDLYGHMLRHALGMILPGLGVGLILAGFGARSLQSLLYNVPALSPTIYVTTALAMGMVCLLAAWLPARRATQVDPSDALRAE
jgi:putative ABC transport system permease protein